MKAFIQKYKWTIFFWLVFLAIVLYFAPRQHDYYLDSDIRNFKRTYITSILVWTGLATSFLIFLVVLFKSKSIKKAGISFLSAGVTFAFLLFIFQDLIVGASLFINRQYKRDTLKKSYVVSFMPGTDPVKDNFFPFDLSTKQPIFERKLINKIYDSTLKENDTITINFNRGFFGIPFDPKPLDDKFDAINPQ